MLIYKSSLFISDNTGIQKVTVLCPKVKQPLMRVFSVGSILKVIIKKTVGNPRINLKSGLITILVVCVKKPIKRKNGFFISFSVNRGVIIDNQSKFRKLMAKRIKTVFAKETNVKKNKSFISLAKGLL